MIHEIYSDLPSFKTVKLTSGLNILVVSKSPDSTTRHTRNKAGKTSLIELMHLMLGADIDRRSLICEDMLSMFTFGMILDVMGSKVSIERSCKQRSKILIESSNFGKLPIHPYLDNSSGKFTLPNEKWKDLLGYSIFNLPFAQQQRKSYAASFRSLISYFLRRESVGGFSEPQLNSSKQQLWDSQTALSYLLGFDLDVPYQFQQIRLRERTIRELRKLLSSNGEFKGMESIGNLRTEATLVEGKVEKLNKELTEFRILESYHALESEADELVRIIREISNEDVIDKEYLRHLKEAFASENPPKLDDVIKLYNEAISEVPSIVVKKLTDAKIFYETIVKNRELYLRGEITNIENKMRVRNSRALEAERRRVEIMKILSSHGALEQYTKLQSELAKQRGALEVLQKEIKLLEQLSVTKSEAKMERAKLELMLKRNYEDEREIYKRAIDTYGHFSGQFYQSPGNLVIDPTSNGPEFRVTIQGERSKGVKNIQIFCFDMMLMQIAKRRQFGIDFLVHDSHIFDGVDERQIAVALKIAKETSEKLGFQYIVTLNSDVLPGKEVVGIDFDSYKVAIELNDKTETGGLFGLAF